MPLSSIRALRGVSVRMTKFYRNGGAARSRRSVCSWLVTANERDSWRDFERAVSMRSALVAIGAARQAFNGSDASISHNGGRPKLIFATQLVADKLPAQIQQLPSRYESLMPRIIVLALLFFVSVTSIVDAAPIRIAYKGRFVDLDRRFEPNGPFYCDVHGEFVIDEALPSQQTVVSASMVIDDKEMSLLAPADWRSIVIRNDVSGDFYGYPDKMYDEIWFGARFAGWGGVVYEEHGDYGYEVEDPTTVPNWPMFDLGYGISISLMGPSSSFDPITGLRSLETFDRIVGTIDYRDWRLRDEQTWSTLELTSIKVVPEPNAMALILTPIIVGLSLLSRIGRIRKVRR